MTSALYSLQAAVYILGSKSWWTIRGTSRSNRTTNEVTKVETCNRSWPLRIKYEGHQWWTETKNKKKYLSENFYYSHWAQRGVFQKSEFSHCQRLEYVLICHYSQQYSYIQKQTKLSVLKNSQRYKTFSIYNVDL